MGLLGSGLFGALSGRLAWIGQRQLVLSENLANANTPGFAPNDVREPSFDELMRVGGRSGRLAMQRTAVQHLDGKGAATVHARVSEQAEPYEIAPDGNAVVLEEQMQRMMRTQMDHQLTSNLYRKYLGMMRTALGTRGGHA